MRCWGNEELTRLCQGAHEEVRLEYFECIVECDLAMQVKLFRLIGR